MKFVFLITALLLLSLNAHSQSKANAGKQYRPASPTYATSEISPEISSLPPRFLGHSPFEIYLKLLPRKDRFKKGEFETTVQHKARMEKEKAMPLIGSLTMNSYLAFSFLEPSVQYDADESKLTISVTSGTVDDDDGATYINFSGLSWVSSSKRLGSYIGSNAFGVKKRIQTWKDTEITIAVPNSTVYSSTTFNAKECSFTVTPEDARVLKQTARLLIIGKLITPYIGKGVSEDDPTFTNPNHIVTTTIVVYMKRVQIKADCHQPFGMRHRAQSR